MTISNAQQVDLFYENFNDESNGATTGTDLYGIPWNVDVTNASTNYFNVYDDSFNEASFSRLFWAEDTDGIAYWYTQDIDITNYENLSLSSYIFFDGLENSDFIKFQYKVDGGDLEDVTGGTYNDDTSSNTTYSWDLTGVTGAIAGTKVPVNLTLSIPCQSFPRLELKAIKICKVLPVTPVKSQL